MTSDKHLSIRNWDWDWVIGVFLADWDWELGLGFEGWVIGYFRSKIVQKFQNFPMTGHKI
jgi:hypothetical protein